MDSAELRQLGANARLAPLAQDRAAYPADFRAQTEVGDYLLDLTPGGQDLVISFDADDSVQAAHRPPWLHRAFRDQGLAVLGIKVKRNDWYRGEPLHDFFESADFRELLAAYDRVVFTGASMGGFAALAFATPGALVVAHNPPTELDPALTPANRYPETRDLDWSGRFARAAEGARQAERVFVTYDPFDAIDSRHVDRLDPANLVRLRAPLLGHPLAGFLRRIGLLAELVPLAISGELTPEWWRGAIRRRRELARYHLLMAEHLDVPERVAQLMARAWHLSADERRAQDRIRRMVTQRKLGALFEHHLEAEKMAKVVGPAGPDAELFRQYMTGRS